MADIGELYKAQESTRDIEQSKYRYIVGWRGFGVRWVPGSSKKKGKLFDKDWEQAYHIWKFLPSEK